MQTGSILIRTKLPVSGGEAIAFIVRSPFATIYQGKTVSCGAIVFYCLNLPPDLRYCHENTFIAGLTPPPNPPTMITISHVIDPVVDSALKYGTAPRPVVPTCCDPDGVEVDVKIAPLIADHQGITKVGGFLDTAATMFCPVCLCTQAQIEEVDLSKWILRNGSDVQDEAATWMATATKSGRTSKAKETGVRWTPLHRLPYWDPVKHVVLSFMHNWLEGILKHHLHVLWCIGLPDEVEKAADELKKDEQWSEADTLESADELLELEEEAAEAERVTRRLSSTLSTTSHVTPTQDDPHPNPYPYMDVPNDGDAQDNPQPNPNTPMDVDNDDDDPDDPDFVPADSGFSSSELAAIRDCISNISLPTWVGRPPSNLGNKSHGKLKAHEFLSLYSAIFPLIIPEFWHSPTATETQTKYLECFHHLVSATNITCSFRTSNEEADRYTHHYTEYRKLTAALFPDSHSQPNHHWAMHVGSQLKYWGPNPPISEFFGERMNGMLQNINTNRRLRTFG